MGDGESLLGGGSTFSKDYRFHARGGEHRRQHRAVEELGRR